MRSKHLPSKPPIKLTKLHAIIKKNCIPVVIPAERVISHQKSKTQNINIYNIIHNVTNQQSFFQGYPIERDPPADNLNKTAHITQITNFEQTMDSRPKKSKHDIQLDEELNIYKVEIEDRFNASSSNQNYVFPRKLNKNENNVETNSESAKKLLIPASIYPKINMQSENNRSRQLKKEINKTTANSATNEKNQKPQVNFELLRDLDILLSKPSNTRNNLHENLNKLVPYTSNRTEVNTKSASPVNGRIAKNTNKNNLRESYYLNAAKTKANSEKNNSDIPVLSVDSIKIGQMQNQKTKHNRTKTMENTSADFKQLMQVVKNKPQNIRIQKKPVHDYFKDLLINQKSINLKLEKRPASRSSKGNSKISHKNNLSGIVNSTSFLNMTMNLAFHQKKHK